MCSSLLSMLSAFTPVWWSSVGLGAAIGLVYTVISLIANRLALRKAQLTFMVIVLGGMVVRMGAALIAVVLILLLLPVEQIAFVGSFLGVFILGMIAEVLYVRRAGGSEFNNAHAANERAG